MFQEKKCIKNVRHDSYLFTEIACRSPYAVFLGHSAREIHSIALDETHDENVSGITSKAKSCSFPILKH